MSSNPTSLVRYLPTLTPIAPSLYQPGVVAHDPSLGPVAVRVWSSSTLWDRPRARLIARSHAAALAARFGARAEEAIQYETPLGARPRVAFTPHSA
jgi:hypothetical protein